MCILLQLPLYLLSHRGFTCHDHYLSLNPYNCFTCSVIIFFLNELEWMNNDIKLLHLFSIGLYPWRTILLLCEIYRWVSFDIKFTRQGFENACWHREACRASQHAFSKPSLVNLISNYVNLVFHLSVYPLFPLQTSDYDVIFGFVLIQVISDAIQKGATSSWPDKGTCREIGNVYQASCINSVDMRGNW